MDATNFDISFIYPIICLKSVCLATFAECSSQFLIVRFGRCLKLIAPTRGTFCHEFASQFGLELFLYGKKRQITVDRPAAVDRHSVADIQLHLNGRNPFSPRSSVPRDQRENAAITVQTPCREQYFFHFYCLRLTRLTLNKS